MYHSANALNKIWFLSKSVSLEETCSLLDLILTSLIQACQE